jgi:hypothetical protein
MAEASKTAAPKAAKATKAKATTKATPAAPEGERCQVAKCKQPVRAKGLCRKHFLGWRRGKVGEKHRYNTCSKPECRKPATIAGRCEEHAKGRKAAAGGESAPAA